MAQSIFGQNLTQYLGGGYGSSPRFGNQNTIYNALLAENVAAGENKLKAKALDLDTKNIESLIAARQNEYDLAIKKFQESQKQYEQGVKGGLYGAGVGTPEERKAYTMPYGFTTEPTYSIPGTDITLYGTNAASAATQGLTGPGASTSTKSAGTSSYSDLLAQLQKVTGLQNQAGALAGPLNSVYQNPAQANRYDQYSRIADEIRKKLMSSISVG